jgi:[ribosomal protein S5]-alanine N-acetyltransferase
VSGVTTVTETAQLREFRADDLDDADTILGDDRVTRWLSFDSRTRDQQVQMLTGVIERATHTPRTIIDFGFTTLGLRRISGAIGPDNAASIALITRLGFTREGRLRDHVFTNGAWRDSILYSLLAHEWEASLAAHE